MTTSVSGRFLLMCLFLGIILSGRGVKANYLVPYEENVETYVDYPTDTVSEALLTTQPLIPKVHLALWTTVDDFRHPLFYLVKGIVRRLDKELLIFEPSYYLRDGLNEGCRITDPVTNQEIPNFDDKPECADNCTNYGRYCSGSVPTDASLAARTDGADIVTESLRQLCVWVVYGKTGGDNMLHFFRYVNDLLLEMCDNPFSKNCTYSVMDRISISPHFIERCMNHTHGLDSDSVNPYLKEQVDKSRDITAAMVPRLKIGNYWYNGEESTAEIFRAVCAAYPSDKQPIACDFCKDCDDVRYCLWHLQCNGQTFEMYAANKQNDPNYQIPPQQPSQEEEEGNAASAAASESAAGIPTTAPSSMPLSDSPPIVVGSSSSLEEQEQQHDNLRSTSSENDDNNNSDSDSDSHNRDKKAAQDALISGILVGLSLGLVVSSVYACRDWQAKLMLNEIRKEDRAMAAAKRAEEAAAKAQDDVSPTSAAGMLRRLQDIEAMIDGGKDVGDLLDVVSERTGRSIKARVDA